MSNADELRRLRTDRKIPGKDIVAVVQEWITAMVTVYTQGENKMFNRELQNPDITNIERTGYRNGREPEFPRCPVCGAECEKVYRDNSGAYVGCDVCIEPEDAREVPECFPGEETV